MTCVDLPTPYGLAMCLNRRASVGRNAMRRSRPQIRRLPAQRLSPLVEPPRAVNDSCPDIQLI